MFKGSREVRANMLRTIKNDHLFIHKAVSGISDANHWDSTLKSVVRLCVPDLADVCMIRVHPPGADWYEEGSILDKNKLPVLPSSIHNVMVFESGWIAPLHVHNVFWGYLIGFNQTEKVRQKLRLIRQFAFYVGILLESSWCREQTAQAIKSRDDFLITASHELKTPITTLRIQAHAIKKMLTNSKIFNSEMESAPRLLELMERQTVRLESSVGSLLEASRAKSGKLKLIIRKTNLASIVRQLIEHHELELKLSGCEIKLFLDENIFGNWDEVRIEQALSNILVNSIKYGRGHPIEIEVSTTNHSAKILIRDFGIGIPDDQQKNIFKIFERSVSTLNFSGFGIGLYVSKWIIDAHHGDIQINSKPGLGTEFIVTIPLEQPQVA